MAFLGYPIWFIDGPTSSHHRVWRSEKNSSRSLNHTGESHIYFYRYIKKYISKYYLSMFEMRHVWRLFMFEWLSLKFWNILNETKRFCYMHTSFLLMVIMACWNFIFKSLDLEMLNTRLNIFTSRLKKKKLKCISNF